MKTKVRKLKRNPGNRGTLRVAAAQGQKTPVQQALESRKETAAIRSSGDFLKAVEKFSPVFEKLADAAQELILDVRDACADVIAYLRIAPTKEGKKRAQEVIKACTQNPTVLVYAARWLAVILAEKKGANIGTVSRELESNKWSDIPATSKTIESQSELLSAATKANEALGVKARGRTAGKGKNQQQGDKITLDNVFDLIPQILESQAGRAKLRAILNTHGYDLTAGPGAIKTAKTA